MGIANEALLELKARLCSRIDRIAHDLPHMTLHRLAHEIDDLRRTAREYGLSPVAEIAGALESALSASHDQVMILPYLDSMRDAVGCEQLDPNAGQAYLTLVNHRLYG